MKHINFAGLLILCSIMSPLVASSVSLGIKGGLCLSKFSGSDARGWDSKTDVCGYGFLNLPFINEWSLLCETGYTVKGSFDPAVENNFTYLEIPLLLRYNLQSMATYKTSLYCGPAFSYLLSAQQTSSTTGTTDLNNTASSDIGIAAGGIMEMPVNFGSVVFDVRYTQGFVRPLSNYLSYDLKNSALSIMIGLNFYLNGSSPSVSSDGADNYFQ